ncbi:MAG TPA: STAS domain-containing protein [Nitrosospira sp.]|nr:STAS domain-containing protein [Nitrosospira sp.]
MSGDIILHEGEQLSVEGSVTIDNVVSVVARGMGLLDRGDVTIDLAGLTEADSSVVSLLLEWRREAARRNRQVCIANMPENLQSLVRLYGVSELINLQTRD